MTLEQGKDGRKEERRKVDGGSFGNKVGEKGETNAGDFFFD